MRFFHNPIQRSILPAITAILIITALLANLNPAAASYRYTPPLQSNLAKDYVILLDISGSMLEQITPADPPKIDQVKNIAKNFIDTLQPGSNLILYTFNTEINKVAESRNISDSDKPNLKALIDGIRAERQDTRLWDSICMGLDTLENLSNSDHDRLQMLISFTDGMDTASQKTANDCVPQFERLYKERYIMWLYNAFGGSTVPNELNGQEGIRVIQDQYPQEIRVVQIAPVVLNFGNLYEQGKNTDQVCLLSWASREEIYGGAIHFASAPTMAQGNLPQGTAMQVCQSGTNCERSLPVLKDKACIDISLINYNQSLGETSQGDFSAELPIEIAPQNGAQVFAFPAKIRLNFEIAKPLPTPVIPTATSAPTGTPLPTMTPLPGPVTFDCMKDGAVDLGTFRASGSNLIACTPKWDAAANNSLVRVQLTWDSQEETQEKLSKSIWFVKQGGIQQKYADLTPADKQIYLAVMLSDEDYNQFSMGSHQFNGVINVKATGAVPAKNNVPVHFTVSHPVPLPWLLLGGGGLALLIAAVGVIITRPRIPGDVQLIAQNMTTEFTSKWWDGSTIGGDGNKGFLFGNQREDVVRISPDFCGSLLGRLLGQRNRITYTLTPIQSNIKIQLPGKNGAVTNDPVPMWDNGDVYTVIDGSRRYPLALK